MSEQRTPKVSLGLPVYNEERYLRETLDSILNQDFGDFELIVSDNASTDATEEICWQYAQKDARIRYVRQDHNMGQILNLNEVFLRARGTYFKWCGGHDILHSAFLSRCLTEIDPRPSVICCYPIVEAIETDGTHVPDSEWTRIDTRTMNLNSRVNTILWGMSGCNPIFGLLRTDALRRTRLFRYVVCPDNLIIFELSLVGHIAFIPEKLLFARRPREPETYSALTRRYRRTWYPEGRSLYFRAWLSNWRLLFEHIRSILFWPVPFRKKFVLLISVVWALTVRRGKHMIHDLIEAVGLPRP